MATIESFPSTAYLSDTEQILALEQELAADVFHETKEYLGAVVLRSPDANGHFGAIGRSLEMATGFTEMAQTSSVFEETSKFIYIFDREAERYITHSTRIIQPNDERQLAAVEEIMQDLEGQVDLGQAMTHHRIKDVTRCSFVSTDLAVPDALPTRHKPYGLLAYKTLFDTSQQEQVSHVFAYMNVHTLRGLGRLGIAPEPLCGKSDYYIPPMGDLTFEAYQPYVIPVAGHNSRVFNDAEYAGRYSRWGATIAAINLPTIRIEDELLHSTF